MLRFVLVVSLSLFSWAAPAAICAKWSAPKKVGQLDKNFLPEASGIAISKQFSNRVYHHNDSGDAGVFYMTDLSGAHTQKIPFTSDAVQDIEDMSIGPCSSGQCLFMGDIGDNYKSRSNIRVWILPETQSFSDVMQTARKITLKYPDGARDAESLAIHPITGDLYILSKEYDSSTYQAYPARLYYLPKDELSKKFTTLRYVGSLDLPRLTYSANSTKAVATSMDISPDGKRLVILTYDHAIEVDMAKVLNESLNVYRWSEGKDYRLISLWHLTSQQEAISYSPDGKSFYFDSEFNSNRGDSAVPLFRVDCL